jgi:hypothetical protein
MTVSATTAVYIDEDFTGESVVYNSTVKNYNIGMFSKNGGGTFTVGSENDDSFLNIADSMNVIMYRCLLPDVAYPQKREMEVKFQFSGTATSKKGIWMNILNVQNASAFGADKPTGSADNDQYLYLNAGVSTHILAPVSADTWHTVRMVFSASPKTVYAVELDGVKITTLVNGTAFPVSGINLGTHGGFSFDLIYSSLTTDYSPIFTTNTAGSNLKISNAYYGAVQNSQIVSTSVANNGVIPTDGEVSFTFDNDMIASSFTTSSVLFYEGSKARVCSGVYDSLTKTYTVSFSGAPLAPLTQYTLTLTTAISNSNYGGLVGNYSLTFNTSYDGNYLSDNFSRYPKIRISGYPTEVLPWVKISGHGGQVNDFKTVGGKNAITLITVPTTYTTGAYLDVTYNTAYLPNVTYADTRVAEIEFDFSGDPNSEISIWSELFKIKPYDKANGNMSPYLFVYANQGYTPIAPITAGDTHNVKIVYRANPRICYGIEIDGVKVTTLPDNTLFPITGILLSSHGSYPIDYKYSATGTTTSMFKLNSRTDTLGCTQQSTMNIYNVDYYPAPVYNIQSISVADGTSNISNTDKIDIVFDKPMSAATLTNQTITLLEAGQTVPVSYKGIYNSDTMTYTLDLSDISLKTSTSYTLTLTTEVTDLYSGKAQSNTSLSFTTSATSVKKVNILADIPISIAEGTVQIPVKAENITDGNLTDCVLIVSIYKRTANCEKLVGISTANFNVNAYETTETITSGINVSSLAEGESYVAKAMIWDSFQNVKPLTGKKILN